jgi:hypothetical protein
MSGQVSSVRLDGVKIPWTLSLACRTNQHSTRLVAAILDILNAHIDVIRGEAGAVRRLHRGTAASAG